MFVPDYNQCVIRLSNYIRRENDRWDVFQNAALKFYSSKPDYLNNPKSYFLYALDWAIMDWIRELYKIKLLPLQNHDMPEYQNFEDVELFKLILSNSIPEIIQFYEGFSLKEMAKIHQCTVNAIKIRRFKGIRKLRRRFNNEYYI